ncbi:MAG: hypothetical protein ABIG45_00640 [Bacillota bacterium]
MKKTFEHLLGLTAKDALAILKSSGNFDVRITYTFAPRRPGVHAARPTGEAPGETTMLRAVADSFQVSEREPAPDPLLEPVFDDGMLSEARVVGVRDDGKQLLVSCFRVSPDGDTRKTKQ